ncbi:Tetratricopeptide-like helical [Phaffia rhodozyma]|uniref:Tetratricopeptide-like helical n=1 Tax=Phaffia rhodozyma TaxID=264483 RepID=A0A0F7SRK7_PHARH|nr:Tetratricopeptide-like helical [Phaffia rhodozyma]
MTTISADLSALSIKDLGSVPLEELLTTASTYLVGSPQQSLPYLNQALILSPSSAPIHAQRAVAYTLLENWPRAYFDACQGLDDDAEGLTDELRAELIGLAGKCAAERMIWDLAVIHLEEAIGLTRTSALLALQAKALSNLQKTSVSPVRTRMLNQRKTKFLEEAFPGIDEDEEWESSEGEGHEEDGGDDDIDMAM